MVDYVKYENSIPVYILLDLFIYIICFAKI